MKAQHVLAALKEALGDHLRDPEIRTRTVGVKSPQTMEEIWGKIDRDVLLQAAQTLKDLGPLHISIISGADLGEEIELLYHFTVGYGTEGGEVLVTLRFTIPKSDLTVPSLCGIIPGAETTEREKIEFLGVAFQGIPDSRHLFLPEDMEVHPWRKDEPELEKLVRRTVKWEERDA
ncbi:TPA: NADH-quinone oxidoreductase subunit C [Candidatus Bipolaricaulota bacterium]|nr:NADH-quinone oxidoreductase subunit C [Candidatus Bipolaricaulota bacterium]